MNSTERGRVVERIVALFHERPGTKVTRNVRLIPTDPHSAEMDVLVVGSFQGYPVRLGFDCKNHKDAVGIEYVRDFLVRLEQFGIPRSYGFMVSASPFTEPALELAESVGVRTFLLDGLAPDQLSERITEALQSIVLIIPTLHSIGIAHQDTHGQIYEDFFFIEEESTRYRGFIVQDHILLEWFNSDDRLSLGDRRGALGPKGYYQFRNNTMVPAVGVAWWVKVIALVGFIPGQAKHLRLTDAKTGVAEKQKILLDFPLAADRISLTVCKTEDELAAALDAAPARYKIVPRRLGIPRLVMNLGAMWPPSEALFSALNSQIKERERKGEAPDPGTIDVRDMLGDDILASLARPIWSGYPLECIPRVPQVINGKPVEILALNLPPHPI